MGSITVVITGASKGVGAACVHGFAKAFPDGVNLVLVARGIAGLKKLEEELAQYANVKTLTLAADIGDLQACKAVVDATIEAFGCINVLVNNAGLHHRGNFSEQTPEQIAAMVDINLKAPLYLAALVLPHMQPKANGTPNAIVMVGSLAGRAPLQGAATYSGTKSGLRAFTYALSDELREKHINVAVVSPGPIDTSFIMDEIDEVEDIVYSQPMSSPEQVADSIVALASGENTEISMPWFSGKLTTLGYLFPRFRRVTRGLLYQIGRKNKDKYRQRKA
ncbi:SDR family oxidoreductase [Shewanella sp. UCD-KL12]|uniref:SDR family NAD(P)-dependent oxidoreductase n=1 Tax=Shewanella sp. UCD-KL12 TaxID=1917163 RepID=UPI000970C7B4|nr:SDR family NAD(P)-dependent oxidoreductase [Shewanella sp. UCD-KL12]